jgi:hypothetical protein
MLIEPIFQDHLIDNLSAKDTAPPEKLFAVTIKFLVDHFSAASMTFHINFLLLHTDRPATHIPLPS